MTFVHNLVMMKYGGEFRAHRKMFHEYFSKEKSKEYRFIETREARFLVQNLMTTPEKREEFFVR